MRHNSMNVIRHREKIPVLIAVNEEKVRSTIKRAIFPSNCGIVGEVTNGKQALKLFERFKPKLSFLDIDLPVINGKEALAAIMEEDPEAIVVVFTPNASIDVVLDLVEKGASQVLKADISSMELKYVVRRLIRENQIKEMRYAIKQGH